MAADPAAKLVFRDLAERYAFACDRRDADAFAGVFTADGVLEAPRGRFSGRSELRGVIPMMARLYLKTFHAVLGQQVEIDGDNAQGETYSIARHYFEKELGDLRCYEMTIRYQDRFRREGAEWRFSSRTLVVEATHTFAVQEPSRQAS
ncbi:MAG: nuclear transport factor 2 family protein [Rhizobiaceae bacterium]|nr:nuclear transport factor 2 family protein [Rhizobiaceae bacterium]